MCSGIPQTQIRMRSWNWLVGYTTCVATNEGDLTDNHVLLFPIMSIGSEGGKPDSVVHLPNEGHIAIDSKFPLQAFLEAVEALTDVVRKEKCGEHVKVLKAKILELSKKTALSEKSTNDHARGTSLFCGE